MSSVTFVSASDGWVLGAVACTASPECLALLHTADGGKTWRSVNPPPTGFRQPGSAGGVSGVSQMRFANSRDGWAFDPGLWATQNGGTTWSQITLPGVPANAAVLSLETASGEVTAVVLDPMAGVINIETSSVGTDTWLESPTAIPMGAGPATQTQLVLQGSSGWVLVNDRTVIGGARLVGGHWARWKPPCTGLNGPAYIAASTAGGMYAVCDEGEWGPPGPPATHLYLSTNGGNSFEAVGDVPQSAVGLVLASPTARVAVTDSAAGLLATFNGGETWSTVYKDPSSTWPTYVGFESASQGVAIAVDDQGSTPVGFLLMTSDGGHNWSAVRL